MAMRKCECPGVSAKDGSSSARPMIAARSSSHSAVVRNPLNGGSGAAAAATIGIVGGFDG